MRKGIIGLATLLILGVALAITGDEVMQKVEARPSPKTLHGRMVMTLVNKQGKKLTRELELWSKDEGDVKKMLIKFLAPADVKGTAFLSIQRGDKQEMKLYLPALKRVRRIAGSQKKGSFMGSDFSYDDIAKLGSLKAKDFKNTLKKEEEQGGVKLYVVEAVPKPGVEHTYDREVIWVRADIYVPVRIEFYKKGKLYKVMTLEKIESFADGKYEIPTQLTMENVKTHHKTVLSQKDLEIDQPIPDSVFTERFMKR